MICLFGQSMLLSLVAASIEQNANLHVVHAASWGEVEAIATDSPPDVLIYDLAGAYESQILPLLSQNPRLLLFGLDAECNRAVLLAGKETRSLTLERVKEIIERPASISQDIISNLNNLE